MYCGIYKIADSIIEINSIYDEVQEMCQDYRVDEVPEIKIQTGEEEILFEKEKSIREDIIEGNPVRYFTDSYLETLAVYRKIAAALIDKDILLFHGSVVAVDGEGYLFTARSGTGKSTHTRLWCEKFGERAFMLNDDKPLLSVKEGQVIAYGTPWDGKHHLSRNTSVPLKAICILERDETNHIEEISYRNAFPMLLQQCYRPTDALQMTKTIKMLERLESGLNLYRLGCNMNPEAADIAYKGMR